MQTLGLSYRLTVRDANGRIVSRTRLRKGRSYLKQFVQILWAHMYYTESATLVDTANAAWTLDATPPAGNIARTDGGIAIETHGPVVGTGSTAVTVSDYVLATRIVHGTGASQMEYGATTTSSVSVAGSTASFTLSRPFTNSSGSSITVNEIGVYVFARETGTANKTFCIVRDVVAGGQAVGNTNTLTVEYVVKATV